MSPLRIPLSKTWEIAKSTSLDSIFKQAKELGWLENKVQVRKYTGDSGLEYVIEPYEKDCGCPGIINPPIIDFDDEEPV